MSNPIEDLGAMNCDDTPCKAIKRLIRSKEKDLGDFSVRRLLPVVQQRQVGPWIFFDHMGPAQFEPGQGVNVRPHPHINLATVTYLFDGEILHRDSLGYTQTITPGDINLMVAGKGIVHSERERPEVNKQHHNLHGLQLWMALPEQDEETDPAFYHYPSSDIPSADINSVNVKVMMGSAYGLTSPVKTFADTLYIEAHLSDGLQLDLPQAEESALYVAQGKVEIAGVEVKQYELAVLSDNCAQSIVATQDARIAVIGGEKMSERHMFWNFASSSLERIEQAKLDWQQGKFPKVPGDDKEFIPLPG